MDRKDDSIKLPQTQRNLGLSQAITCNGDGRELLLRVTETEDDDEDDPQLDVCAVPYRLLNPETTSFKSCNFFKMDSCRCSSSAAGLLPVTGDS